MPNGRNVWERESKVEKSCQNLKNSVKSLESMHKEGGGECRLYWESWESVTKLWWVWQKMRKMVKMEKEWQKMRKCGKSLNWGGKVEKLWESGPT